MAQSTPHLAPPPQNLAIDGNLSDWGDSLRYHNEEKKLNYTLANDRQNLYAVIRINDRMEQARILNAGLTLSVDTRGKKKESYSVTFPLPYPEGSSRTFDSRRNGGGEITQEDRDALMREELTTLRGIKVHGFTEIDGDMISTSNTYGIQAAIKYDADGNLVCEMAVPLKFFHADDPAKNEWAFNFKINGIQKPDQKAQGSDGPGGGGMGGMGGGRGGRGGGMGGGMGGGRGGRGGGMGRGGAGGGSADRSELFKSVDFWEKYYLAK